MKKRWEIKQQGTKKGKLATEEIVKILLKNRGLTTKKQQDQFFNPPNPQKLTLQDVGISKVQLNKAVKRIKKAIKNKEKIIVYGDYDVDGIAACAILWETLYHDLSANAFPYIPSRFAEGYGLNADSIRQLKEKYPEIGLIIAVDHGIVAHDKIDFAKTLGIDVIVCDHHEPAETKPSAHAIIHTTQISGSAVSWFLAKQLVKDKALVADHLGLAALGTVADVLPLVGHNRAIAVHGLSFLRKSDRPGIAAVCQQTGIKQEEIDTFHIGFILGPRLNAMGRVEHAVDSLRLLCVRNTKQASEFARKLGDTNRLRQEKTGTAVNHVELRHGPSWADGNLPKVLFVHHESYEEGVIGIVAGRLVEKYHRPSIVVSAGEEVSKGSARSISGVNIVELIRRAGKGLLLSVGGHKMAAGFSIKTADLELFAQKLAGLANKEIGEELLLKNVRIDCSLSLSNINLELYKKILEFAPFGYGNPEPTFVVHETNIKSARTVGRDNSHLKLKVADPDSPTPFEAIAFRMGDWYAKLSPEKAVDLVFSLDENVWNGTSTLQLKVKDLKLHHNESTRTRGTVRRVSKTGPQNSPKS